MSKRKLIYTICDGCFRNTYDDGISIRHTHKVREYEGAPESTVDICEDCADAEMYYCRGCKRVHDDAHPCAWQAEQTKLADEAAQEYWTDVKAGKA